MRKIYFSLFLFFMAIASAFAQRTVSGKVTDESGEGLPGVNVVIKGTTIGVTSDLDGNYSISVPDDNVVLVFSSVGMGTQEIAVGSRTSIDIGMTFDSTELSEVVVVAYGTQSKESLTGAVSVINSDQTKNLTYSNPVMGLEGLASGLRVIQSDGRPGADPIIRIRGFGSVNADSQPLIVLDGVPYSGSLSSINPQDIESTTVLKDASSTSLYGNKASNGVLIINTKKGSSKKTIVTLDTRVGITQRAAKDYNVTKSPAEFYEMYHSVLANSEFYDQDGAITEAQARQFASDNLISELGNYNLYDVADADLVDPTTGKLNPNANLLVNDSWEDALFRDQAVFRSTNLSASGGSKDISYYFSIGSETNEGYTVGSGFERNSGRFKVESSKILDVLTVGGDIAYASSTSRNVPATVSAAGIPQTFFANSFGWARRIAPIYPVYAYDKDWNPILANNPSGRAYDFGATQDFGDGTQRGPRNYAPGEHPIAVIENTLETTERENFNGAFRTKVDLPLGIQFQYVMNLLKQYDKGIDFTKPGAGAFAQANNGLLTVGRDNFSALTNQQILTWEKDFNDQSLDVLMGHETYEENFTTLSVDKRNIISGFSPILNNTAVYASADNYNTRYMTEGYFTRIIYGFKGNYFVNLSGRYDASSVFHPDERWGAFWSAGASWIMSNENFLKNINAINFAKLSANYGTTGNDRIFYPGTGTRNFVTYEDQYVVNESNGELTQTLFTLGNPLTTWEKASSLDVALEMGLFDQLNLTVGYYRKESNDLLFNNPIPASTGQTTYPENFGSMMNSGIEAEILWNAVKGDKFNLAINWNGSTLNNKILELPDDSIQVGNFRRVVDRSLFDYYMVRSAGVNAANGNAQYYTVDGTGETVVTEDYNDAATNGRTFLDKEAIPDFFGGFGFNAKYGGFSLGVQFAYQIGGYGIDTEYYTLLGASSQITNVVDYDKTWTFDNQTASLPRVDPLAPDQYRLSDMWLVDLSYLSISNINAGYEFKSESLNKYHISGVRLYGTINNAFLLASARQGYDPRLSSIGASAPEYGANRTIALGLNITLD